MNLTLEELRESIAKQEMELYGRTLSDDKTGYYERLTIKSQEIGKKKFRICSGILCNTNKPT